MRSKILLADDHKILTEGLATILSQHYEVVATARNGHELVLLAKKCQPDVIITEISMGLLNAINALQLLRRADVKSKFVVLTMHLDVGLAVEAFRAGVSGYVLKLAGKDEIIAGKKKYYNWWRKERL
jgi:DNA-binding NarL/FixJ family response regulator